MQGGRIQNPYGGQMAPRPLWYQVFQHTLKGTVLRGKSSIWMSQLRTPLLLKNVKLDGNFLEKGTPHMVISWVGQTDENMHMLSATKPKLIVPSWATYQGQLSVVRNLIRDRPWVIDLSWSRACGCMRSARTACRKPV